MPVRRKKELITDNSPARAAIRELCKKNVLSTWGDKDFEIQTFPIRFHSRRCVNRVTKQTVARHGVTDHARNARTCGKKQWRKRTNIMSETKWQQWYTQGDKSSGMRYRRENVSRVLCRNEKRRKWRIMKNTILKYYFSDSTFLN